MGVIYLKEIWAGRGGKDDQNRDREYTRVFQAFTDDFNDGPITVLNAPGLPRLYDAYSTENEADFGSFCISITPSQQEDPCEWLVSCRYSSKVANLPTGAALAAKEKAKDNENKPPNDAKQKPERNEAIPEDPTKRPASVRQHTIRVARVAEVDADGKAILMSSAERVDPPLTKEEIHFIISVVHVSKAGPDDGLIATFGNAINNKSIGLPNGNVIIAGTGKFLSASSEASFENGKSVVTTTYEFEVNPFGWNPTKVIDRGFLRIGPAGEQEPIRTAKGERITSPVLLDGAGQRLVGAVPVFLSFNLYDKKDFNQFPFMNPKKNPNKKKK